MSRNRIHRHGSSAPTSSAPTTRNNSSGRARKGCRGDCCWEELPANRKRELGIVTTDDEGWPNRIIRFAPATRIENFHATRERNQIDYYWIAEKEFDADELLALERFQVWKGNREAVDAFAVWSDAWWRAWSRNGREQ